MALEPKHRPLSGNAAAESQPVVEAEIAERERLLKSIEHLGVKGQMYLLQLVDPGSFNKVSVSMPAKGSEDWKKVEEVVNHDDFSQWILDRLGFLGQLPGGGRLVKKTIPFEKGPKRDAAIAEVRAAIDASRKSALLLAERNPTGSAEIVAFAQAQEDSLNDLLTRQENGEKIKGSDEYNFIKDETVQKLKTAQDKGFDVRYVSAFSKLEGGGFGESVVPALQDISTQIKDVLTKTDTVEGVPQERLAITKAFAGYILGRVGEEHETESPEWQSRLAKVVWIFASYGLTNLSLKESKDEKVKKVEIAPAQLAGTRFLQFVHAYMTGKDKSAFPESMPNALVGMSQSHMRKRINPVHLIVGQLQLSQKIPLDTKEIDTQVSKDTIRIAEKAERLSKERALLVVLQKDGSISFATALANYITLRKEYDSSYDVSGKITTVPTQVSQYTGIPTVERIAEMGALVTKFSKEKSLSRMGLVGSDVRAMVAYAQQDTVKGAEKRLAFAAARAMHNLAQNALNWTLKDVRDYKGKVANNPVLAVIAEKAEKEVLSVKNSFVVQVKAIDEYFKAHPTAVAGDVLDPAKGTRLERSTGVSRQQEVTASPRSVAGREQQIAKLAKDFVESADFPVKVKTDLRDALSRIVRSVKGEKTKDGRPISPLHAVNTVDAIAAALKAKEKSLSPELKQMYEVLTLIIGPLGDIHKKYKAEKDAGTVSPQAKLEDPNKFVTVELLEQIISSIN